MANGTNGDGPDTLYPSFMFDGFFNGSGGTTDCLDLLPPVPPPVKVFLLVVFSSVTVICGVGNSLLCFIVLTQKRLRSVTNLFIANLAFSDLLMAVLSVPFTLHYYLHQDWVFGSWMCSFVGTVKFVSIYVSINTLFVIAVDRYHGIFRPLRPRMEKGRLLLIVLAIWCVSFLVALPTPLFLTTSPPTTDCRGRTVRLCYEGWSNPRAAKGYMIFITVGEFLFPIYSMGFIYISIAVKLWTHRTPPGQVTARHREIMLVRKQKTIPMLITVVVAFFVCYAPYHGYNLAMNYYQEEWHQTVPHFYTMYYVIESVAMLNAVISTFIYFVMSPMFRKETRNLAGRILCRCPPVFLGIRRVSFHSAASHSYNTTRNGSALRKPIGLVGPDNTLETKI
ncbi:prokineticin receptor 2-like [Patiria miniata]|uniref:G-protein coupled receptors family 1 profile domain-containing protein n=1 Tax=Patiria miniata TaxID=46514 RepID=A0A914AII7_PATMI|nr:prokineticin receptor 2-like [Patiria miniata]